ncbi:ArsR/SmtB family transcription factor [Leptolinea tardivitalis]|uniref:HTH arsR-type domain-containing protein n=1 Tax=Leptolinea tardivitalis TaxID=229920 RepID=A0A0N8GLM0_9CHLR|nr:metalloregulator ArsR/SmtB family transcription factor [Leptolinea tardivitalis]KPL72874.1 hypothetical protein ADM99_07445 [Leptolinea tardivitalis]GAP20744.1 transcriptional regulator, ArsR family [Leptolinea tardivitalis]
MPESPVSPEITSDLANLFDSLSDPTRLLILISLLNGEKGVGELVEIVGISKYAISHQLRRLKDRRIINTRKQGRNVYIYLDDAHVVELLECGLSHIQHG